MTSFVGTGHDCLVTISSVILYHRHKFDFVIWASVQQNQQNDLCVQWRLRSAWVSALSDQSLHCTHEAWVLGYPLSAQRSLWSDWADAQADPSLRWMHRSFCWFYREVAHLLFMILLFQVYLVTDSRVLYITEDGGLTFDSFNIPMAVDGELIFHPSKHYQTYILAKTPSRVSLFFLFFVCLFITDLSISFIQMHVLLL